jgi:transposase-like protein
MLCSLSKNALDHLPKKHADDCLQQLRWRYDRRDLNEAKSDLAAWLSKWSQANLRRQNLSQLGELLTPGACARY